MSIGNWNPEDRSEKILYHIDIDVLARCAVFAGTENWPALPAWEKDHLPADASQMMKLTGEQWENTLKNIDNNNLLALVRFFTVAEHSLPHWHGGEKSPVIWISRYLRRQGAPLSREHVLWIKEHSNNRFLPNGSIL